MLQQIFKYKLIPYSLFAAIISQSAISHGVDGLDLYLANVPGDEDFNGRPAGPRYISLLPPGRVYIKPNGEEVFITYSEIGRNTLEKREREAKKLKELKEREQERERERERLDADKAHLNEVLADPNVQRRLLRFKEERRQELEEREYQLRLERGEIDAEFSQKQNESAERERRERQNERQRFNNGQEILRLIRDLLPSNERLFQFYLWHQDFVPAYGVRKLGIDAPDDMVNAAIIQHMKRWGIDAAESDKYRKQFIADLFLYVRLEQYFQDKAVKAGLEGEDVERFITYALLDNDRRAKLKQTGYIGRIREVGPQYTHSDERSLEEIRSQVLGLSDDQISRSGVPPLRMGRYIQKHIKNMCSSLLVSAP